MNYILFDDNRWNHLLPLTYTRPVSEIRIGILTICEKWDKMLNTKCSYYTKDHLAEKFKTVTEAENIVINSGVIPDEQILLAVSKLKIDEGLFKDEMLIAAKVKENQVFKVVCEDCRKIIKQVNCTSDIKTISHPWEIFQYNGKAIEDDFKLLTKDRISGTISKTNQVLNPGNIFIESGAHVEFATLNASQGSIYIGTEAEVMEGSLIRGPFALGEHAIVKMGAKIYGPTTIGPHCRVGGEVNNSVFFGYSNKAHDGFLGNAVLGEWCNLGADTNNSNLKNNYTEVKMWNYVSGSFEKTGLQFCGLVMGDHSKTGINTMFNTGTVVGVSANIYGAGYPRNFIPCFSWGGPEKMTVYPMQKAFEVAKAVMSRRGVDFTDVDKKILQEVFSLTAAYRKYI
jgi:UDP-N-acetylglucosamine diphosphorylase/glucosamine-1-phosphate N-acetyltransferase